MDRKTLTALVIFIALGLVTFWMYRSPERGERVGEKPRPVAKLGKEGFDQVTIHNKGQVITLARKAGPASKGAAWRVVKPVAYPADKYATDSMEKKLIELKFGDLISERKDRHGDFAVDEKKGLRITVALQGKTVADFYLGKTISGFTMFRRVDDNKVWQAAGKIRSAFGRNLKNWRDRRIASFKHDQARRLEIASTAGTVRLTRKDGKAPWALEDAPIPLPKLDQAALRNTLSTLSSLSAHGFADKLDAAKAGLDKPQGAITVTLEGGKSLKVELGGKTKTGRYLRLVGNKQTFEVQTYTAKALLKRPIDLKDKSMLSFDKAKVRAFTLAKRVAAASDTVVLTRDAKDSKVWFGSAPQSPKKRKVASTKKLEEALDALSKLKADHFAKAPAEALGIAPGGWTVTLELDDGKKLVLTVGDKAKEQCKAVQVAGNPDLFMVRKYALDRILLEPKNYK